MFAPKHAVGRTMQSQTSDFAARHPRRRSLVVNGQYFYLPVAPMTDSWSERRSFVSRYHLRPALPQSPLLFVTVCSTPALCNAFISVHIKLGWIQGGRFHWDSLFSFVNEAFWSALLLGTFRLRAVPDYTGRVGRA